MCLLGVITVCLILSILVLLPNGGPNSVHYLQKTQCKIKNITFIENLCVRDKSNDVFILNYKEDWDPCLIPMFDIEPMNIQNIIHCYWYFPESYQNPAEWVKSFGGEYFVGANYQCVIDTIQNICYPDKDEVVVFVVVITSLSVIWIILLITCGYLRYLRKKKEELIQKKENTKTS